jgi:hypothetical protein
MTDSTKSSQLEWWGYQHVNGSLQAKRVFPDTINQDIKDAADSPFVRQVFTPFYADNRQDALQKIEERCTGMTDM